jgi:hypothetical protein
MNPRMSLTARELWTAFHGMALGAGFLLAFSGAFVSLWSMRSAWITPAGAAANGRRLMIGAWAMALLAWGTILVGTLVIYPMYRAKPPKGTPATALAAYPRSLLVSQPQTKEWHEFGMEWKEHVGWLVPILATAVAVVATRYRKTLANEPMLRGTLLVLLSVSFFCACVAGLFGALINKVAPLR